MEKNKKYGLKERIKTGLIVAAAICIGSVILEKNDYFSSLGPVAAVAVRIVTYFIIAWIILLGSRYLTRKLSARPENK